MIGWIWRWWRRKQRRRSPEAYGRYVQKCLTPGTFEHDREVYFGHKRAQRRRRR